MISGSLSVDSLFAGHVGILPTSPTPPTSEGSHLAPFDTIMGPDRVEDPSPIDTSPPPETPDIGETDNTRPTTQDADVNRGRQ
ncbi:MAG: hypothetical protein ACYSR4_03685, partial [Planctomycetota bacterium]